MKTLSSNPLAIGAVIIVAAVLVNYQLVDMTLLNRAIDILVGGVGGVAIQKARDGRSA